MINEETQKKLDRINELTKIIEDAEIEIAEIFENDSRKHMTLKKVPLHIKVGRKPITCSNCGVEGHQSRTCPNKDRASDELVVPPPPMPGRKANQMNAQQFLKVKELQGDGLNSTEVAGIEVLLDEEVRKAFAAFDYRAYLNA